MNPVVGSGGGSAGSYFARNDTYSFSLILDCASHWWCSMCDVWGWEGMGGCDVILFIVDQQRNVYASQHFSTETNFATTE